VGRARGRVRAMGEVAVYVAICIIGGGLIVASRRIPIIPQAVGVVAVIVSVYVASGSHRAQMDTGRSSGLLPRWLLALSLCAQEFSTHSGPRLATARARDGLGARATVRRRSLLAMHDARRARALARERLDAFGSAPRAELLHVLIRSRHASKVMADEGREGYQPDEAANDRDDDQADSEPQPIGGRSSSRRSFSCALPPLHAEHDGADTHGKGGGEQDPEPRDIGRLRNRTPPRKEAFEGCIILFIQDEPNPPCQELDHEGQNPEDERGRRGAVRQIPSVRCRGVAAFTQSFHGLRTSSKGIYAAGDVGDKRQ
jgi:hypothetical protein